MQPPRDNKPLTSFITTINLVADAAYALRPDARTILDVGCGGCFLARRLIQKFPDSRFTLVDRQDRQIRKARKQISDLTNNISFICDDIRAVTLPAASFDIITSALALDTLSAVSYITVLKKFKTWLTDGGALIIANFVGGNHPSIEQLLTRQYTDEIKAEFGPERAQRVGTICHELFTRNSSILTQAAQLQEAGFQKVEILYKRYYDGVYYAIKE